MNLFAEWLEADGLGGFASGTVGGERTRRYHALLLAAVTPPTGRMVLVSGLEAWVKTARGRFAISSQRYQPGTVFPDGAQRVESFSIDPWPRWVFRLGDDTRIEQQLFAVHGSPTVALRWRLVSPHFGPVPLAVRPLLSGRDYHHLHHENPVFRFDAAIGGEQVAWQPYPGVPRITSQSNGSYLHDPEWYRNFMYLQERERGLDSSEDLASPGLFRWDLAQSDAVWLLSADPQPPHGPAVSTVDRFAGLERAERERRARFTTPLDAAADAYLVDGRHGKTILAGYPWFTDWGRDTFVAMRGLTLALGRLDDARQILLTWSSTVSEGMLPNRFPDKGDVAEYNSVDASLWFVIAVGEFLEACRRRQFLLEPGDQSRLESAVAAILTGYGQGTRYGIRADADGLLACGAPGTQLTWMDAKVGDRVVTPRVGKPVEIQALWLNALAIAQSLAIPSYPPATQAGAQPSTAGPWQDAFELGLGSFRRRFWNEARGTLYDVVDVNHQPGTADGSMRPNQILAVGGLPLVLIDSQRARSVVEAVEKHLWTPLGLRTLAPGEPGYSPQYRGGPRERDAAYHQGTVWPWLAGPFVEAWLRVAGNTPQARHEARGRFLGPLKEELARAGLGHLSELADPEPPYTPRGCPFQAWSLGELIRLDRWVLADDSAGNS
ncbi:MAG TPA: amylo-alpha-1,6-glucosidase [Pirellulales bacterium]|jgi:predicted glycogen debranching enzyme|nr:amylo-alpha-1,6-glucosidase [Pirellulales bacterium]